MTRDFFGMIASCQAGNSAAGDLPAHRLTGFDEGACRYLNGRPTAQVTNRSEHDEHQDDHREQIDLPWIVSVPADMKAHELHSSFSSVTIHLLGLSSGSASNAESTAVARSAMRCVSWKRMMVGQVIHVLRSLHNVVYLGRTARKLRSQCSCHDKRNRF